MNLLFLGLFCGALVSVSWISKIFRIFWWVCNDLVLKRSSAEWPVELRGPPKVESNPKLSTSYIPAAMQIIAHDTELMKYVIKPPAAGKFLSRH